MINPSPLVSGGVRVVVGVGVGVGSGTYTVVDLLTVVAEFMRLSSEVNSMYGNVPRSKTISSYCGAINPIMLPKFISKDQSAKKR